MAPPAVPIEAVQSNPNQAIPHFTWDELACDCIKPEYGFGWCDGYPEQDLKNQNTPYLIDISRKSEIILELLLLSTSMIRCGDCNDHWGGIPGSYHTTWQAFDVVVSGHSAYEVAVVANDLTGCGVRHYDIDGFTHLEPAGCGVYCQQAA